MRKELNIYSEDVEPTAAFIISRMFLQAQELRNTFQYEDAMKRLWTTVRAFNRIAISIRGNGEGRETGTHFSIVMSNETSRIRGLITEELGIDPWKEWNW